MMVGMPPSWPDFSFLATSAEAVTRFLEGEKAFLPELKGEGVIVASRLKRMTPAHRTTLINDGNRNVTL